MSSKAKTRPSRPKSKAALSPKAKKSEPTGSPNAMLSDRQAGVRVTPFTALTLGAVYACIRAVSETLAALPLPIYRKRDDGGREKIDNSTVDWLMNSQANPETSGFHWRETTIAHALSWGNGYSEIERDGAGRPVWVWQLTPDRVQPFRARGGDIVYRVINPLGEDTYLEASDVFHLKGPGFDGLVGYSVLRMFARSIGLGIALEESAANFSENDSTPGGVLKHPRKLSPEALKNLRKTWQERHGGPRRRRTVAILEEGMDWAQTGLPPEDSQLIQQRQFTPAEICRIFRVPPHKIADLTRATFSNIEAQAIEWVTDGLIPWAGRVESEGNIKMFGQIQRGNIYMKHNFNALLRGDLASRQQFYTAMLDRAVFSINDVLQLEDRNPIGPDGDKRFVPLNMQLLSQAGLQPIVKPAPKPLPDGTPTPADNPQPDKPQMSAQAAVQIMRPVFEEICGRSLRRATARQSDAAKRFAETSEKLTAWYSEYESDHGAYVSNAIEPGLRGIAMLANGKIVPESVATDFACQHSKRVCESLQAGSEIGAASEAEALLSLVLLQLGEK